MKLASLKSGRDGTLVVVSRDLSRCRAVPLIAPTLQRAIENWSDCAPALRQVYDALNDSSDGQSFPIAAGQVAAPLPRAYQFIDGSAYVKHVELVRKARGAELPPRFWTDPLVYQAVSDHFYGPTDPIEVPREDYGVDFEAELAVITGDLPMGTRAADAGAAMHLFMLVNDVSLRGIIPAELEKGLGFFQGKPTSAFSPVAVTADEFGEAWDGSTLHLELRSTLRGQLFGHPTVAVDQTFSLARLIEHCTLTRHLRAGTIIGTGTISNVGVDVGYSCIAEARAQEMLTTGKPVTSFMRFGDTIRIEMFDRQGASILGAIDQQLVPYTKAAAA